MSNNKTNSRADKIKIISFCLILIFVLIGVIFLHKNSHKDNTVPLEVESQNITGKNIVYDDNEDDNMNWNFYYNSENSWGIADIDSTENKGCVFISNVDIIDNDGIQKSKNSICRFFKLDSVGNIIVEKKLPKSAYKLAYINENNYCLITSNSVQLLDNTGEIKLENNIELLGDLESKGIFRFNNSEFIITGKLDGNAIILKLNLNLEIIKQFRFETFSEIMSLVSSNNRDLYFTGTIKNNFGYGCIDENFNLKWQKKGNSLVIGNNIIKDRDSNFVIIGNESLIEDKITFVLKIDEKGNTIWKKNYYGQNSERDNNLVQLKNCYYIKTFDSKGSGSNLFTKLYKLSFNGDILKESIPKIDGKYILMSNIINNGIDAFLSVGRVDTKGKKFVVSKLNEDAEIGKTKIEYVEETEKTLNINLNFEDDYELQRFLKIYNFHCYIKNGYSATIKMIPENENKGLLTFTFYKGAEILNFQKFDYKIRKNNNQVDFITDMNGEIYLKSNGRLIMYDKTKREFYTFDFREY